MEDQRDDSQLNIGCILFAIAVALLILLVIFLLVLINRVNLSRGENVTGTSTTATNGTGNGSLANCAQIPAEWRSHLEQAGSESGGSTALVAAIFAAGEHRYYQSGKWPAYDEQPAYGTGLNPTKHDGGAGGWVRGPAQFKEQSFQNSRPSGAAVGGLSRFGTPYKVEPYIEYMQPALSAAGVYLKKGGAPAGASDPQVKKAIFSYNHAQWYVDLVFPAYKDYQKCITSSTAAASSGDQTASGNLAARIAETARSLVGTNNTDYNPDSANACASFVSTVLRRVGAFPNTCDFTPSAPALPGKLEKNGAVSVVPSNTPIGVDITRRLQPGDIILFNKTPTHYGHSGIYVGNGKFVAISSSRGVVREQDLLTYPSYRNYGAYRFTK